MGLSLHPRIDNVTNRTKKIHVRFIIPPEDMSYIVYLSTDHDVTATATKEAIAASAAQKHDHFVTLIENTMES